MKRFLILTVAASVLLFLSASSIWAAEITIDWRQKLDSGKVSDLKFMPGQNTFIHNTGYETQIRSCEDGEVIAKYPIIATQYEFTPDSSKLVMLNGFHAIQIRNLSDMSLVNEVERIKDPNGYGVFFDEILVDPVRPLVYARWRKTKGIHETYEEYGKILIFDRETLQQVGELTSGKDTNLYFAKIAISKDGKYLAAMNNKISKLIVWSLDTKQKVVEKYIATASDKFSEPTDIKFSELNTDRIFFTGIFYNENNDGLAGLCIFSISENRIIDSTFAIGVNSGIAHIAFFEYGEKILLGGYMIKVINLNDMQLEYQRIYNENNNIISATYPVYNEEKKFFLGYNPGGIINRFKYQTNTNVTSDNPKEVIYPNPTTRIANIPLDCKTQSRYEIYDTHGRLLNNAQSLVTPNGLLTIDFSRFPAGIYSIKVYCGKNIEQYQVLRGE